MTYFRAKKIALSSALERFTVLFGMGRGGSTPLWSSDIGRLHPVREAMEAPEREGGRNEAHLGYGLRRSATVKWPMKHGDDKCAVIGSSLTGN